MSDTAGSSIVLLIVFALVFAFTLHYCLKRGDDSVILKKAPRISQKELSQYNPENKPFVTCDGTAISPIRFAQVGLASKTETPPRTMIQVFQEAVEKHGDKVAFRIERPVPQLIWSNKAPPALPLSKWKSWTYDKYFDDCLHAAYSLMQIGVAQHDSVCVYGFNSPEWLIAQNAAIMVGAKIAGIYPSDTPQQLHFKIQHSGATVVVVENQGKLEKLKKAIEMGLPKLKAVVMWDDECQNWTESVPCHSWRQFMLLGREIDGSTLKKTLGEYSTRSLLCACIHIWDDRKS